MRIRSISDSVKISFLIVSVLLAALLVGFEGAHAETLIAQNPDACTILGEAGGSTADCDKETARNSIDEGFVDPVINIFSIVIGVAAVTMVIYGGFKYVTSAGDSQKVAEGRKIIIYSLVGLVVIVAIRALIGFVVGLA